MATLLSRECLARLQRLIDHARLNRHRTIVLVSGDAQHNHAIAAQLCSAFFADSLWVEKNAAASCAGAVSCAATQLAQKLGQEFSAVVFDARDGLHADALGIAGGLIRAGGLLMLLAPAPEQWPAFDDPDYRRLMNRDDVAASPRAFLSRLCRHFLPSVRIANGVLQSFDLPPVVMPNRTDAVVDPPYATQEQHAAVQALLRVVIGHRRRPLVLTADRGRGKSAAIGLCCAQLLQLGRRDLVVTAPAPAMIAAVLHHAQQLLPASTLENHRLTWRGGGIRFVAPDVLLQDDVVADAVFVDEAAAIPVPLLSAMLQKFSRIAFVSTINGYEGNGRGFALRFGDALRERTPQFRQLHVSQPVRWNDGDPLELWINALLCLDTAAPPLAESTCMPATRAGDELVYCEIYRDAWLRDEARLRELFALLVLAHYQTTPSDLRWLLDAPSLRIFVALRDAQLIGAVIAVAEGGIDAALHAPIKSGTRRLHGHLVAQRLAIDSNDDDWLRQEGLRVSRIIVHPAWQRRGIGRRLLQKLVQVVRDDVDYVSTSFGASAALVAFWCDAGFLPQRLGHTREQASGEHALVMVHACSAAARQTVQAQRQQFSHTFQFALRAHFSALDADLVIALLRHCSVQSAACCADIVRRFVRGELHLQESLWALWPQVVQVLIDGRAEALSPLQRRVLVMAIVQQRPPAVLRAAFGQCSNAALATMVRDAVASLPV